MEAGLPQARQVVLAVLLSSHLQMTITSMIHGRTMVSLKLLYVENRLCGLHRNQGFNKTSLSLSEEARNTERPHLWNSDLKLRHSRIAFVSAGTSSADELNPVPKKTETNKEVTDSSLKERSAAPVKATHNLSKPYTMTPNTQISNNTLNELPCVSARRVTLEGGLDSMSKQSNKDPGLECAEASNEASVAHHRYADEPSNTSVVAPIMRRSPSSTGSDTSGEVILFAGRRNLCSRGDQAHTSDAQLKNRNATYVSKPSGSHGSVVTIEDRPTNATAQMIENSSEHRPSSFSSPDYERPPDYLSSHLRFTTAKSRRRRPNRQLGKEMNDEGILDDYVANLHESGALKTIFESSMLNQRDIGGSDTAEGQTEVVGLTTGHVEREPITDSEEWDSPEECITELNPWNEGLESIELILSKRERPSGVQFLVVDVGCSVDDARWCPASSLNIQGAESLIQDFENNAELKHHLEGSGVSDVSLTGSEQVTQDLQDYLDVDDGEDERDLEERRKTRMNDERVARLLSKQDELGLGLDDLILYDGDDVGTNSRDEHQLDGLWERTVTHQATPKSGRMKPSRSKILSATALADIVDNDPYNGFDVMDQERPSLHRRPKGRRGKLSVELSGSELEHSLHTAWEKDRTKKKMRKQEREELRAQGLLGKRSQADLKAKYAEGISMTQVKKEIKNFLLSSMERYVPQMILFVINVYGISACRFHRWLKENAKPYTKLPMSSN